LCFVRPCGRKPFSRGDGRTMRRCVVFSGCLILSSLLRPVHVHPGNACRTNDGRDTFSEGLRKNRKRHRLGCFQGSIFSPNARASKEKRNYFFLSPRHCFPWPFFFTLAYTVGALRVEKFELLGCVSAVRECDLAASGMTKPALLHKSRRFTTTRRLKNCVPFFLN